MKNKIKINIKFEFFEDDKNSSAIKEAVSNLLKILSEKGGNCDMEHLIDAIDKRIKELEAQLEQLKERSV
ncbi:hypothetical protein EKI60_06570 [Candidatus Saccharibacteria bacterium]|nr:MAG: hypothetical protein EKI60_06570 [Candidatus Saccharibacteria bacterium]